jgi:hypothetical protein
MNCCTRKSLVLRRGSCRELWRGSVEEVVAIGTAYQCAVRMQAMTPLRTGVRLRGEVLFCTILLNYRKSS